MLYATLPDLTVIAEQPKGLEFESFTPSIDDITEGWVVVAMYTTYDSERSYDSDYRYQVIDLYADRDAAMEAGKRASNVDRWDDDNAAKHGILFADGTPVRRLDFTGWGNSLRTVTVKHVVVKPYQDTVVFGRYM